MNSTELLNQVNCTFVESSREVTQAITSTDFNWFFIFLMLLGALYLITQAVRASNFIVYAFVYVYAFFKWIYEKIRGKK